MVSFQCDACQDVVKKPKLDNHRARCNASFTCIDCSTTFSGPAAYKSHTSCISEDQKYQKALYKGNSNGHGNNAGQSNGKPWQNGGGRNGNGGLHPRYQRPMGTGANDSPLGNGSGSKMTYSPPVEQQVTPAQVVPVEIASAEIVPTAGPASGEPEEKQLPATTGEVTKKKGGLKKGRRDPAPPGESKAERKKRKKEEKTIKKAEKRKKKMQFKAEQAEKARLERKAAQEAVLLHRRETRSTAAAASEGQPAENGTNDAMEVDSLQPATSAVNGDVEMAEGKSSKKSKKRKREQMEAEDGEGSKENGDQEEALSFQEKAKAAKKARKAEKAAKKAAREAASKMPISA